MEESTTKAEEALYLIVEGVSYKGLYVWGAQFQNYGSIECLHRARDL